MKNSSARRVSCPECAASVPLEHGGLVVRCRYCGLKSAIVGYPSSSRYYIPSVMDEKIVKSACMKKMLNAGLLTPKTADRAIVDQAELFFVPYSWITAIKTGRLKKSRDDTETTVTKVFSEDYEAFRPACDIPYWGLKNVRLDEALNSMENYGLMPYERLEMSRRGHVLSVQRELDVPRGTGRVFITSATRKLIFYPIWLFRYRIDNSIYRGTLDGVTQKLLYGRAPQDSENKYLKAAALIGLVGLMLGQGLRLLFLAPAIGVVLLLTAVVIGVLVALTGLSLIRFHNELVYEDGTGVRESGSIDQEFLEERIFRSLAGVFSDDEAARLKDSDGGKADGNGG